MADKISEFTTAGNALMRVVRAAINVRSFGSNVQTWTELGKSVDALAELGADSELAAMGLKLVRNPS